MSEIQPEYVTHAHLPGTTRVPSNMEAVLSSMEERIANPGSVKKIHVGELEVTPDENGNTDVSLLFTSNDTLSW